MNMKKEVRTRIAPSPTGDPHIGTAYTALFNYAFAKSRNGRFILRIEDTDQKRSSIASERAILESLHWLGISWDEGPDIGGTNGPYRQSERTDIYRAYAAQLVKEGHAYPCFCSSEGLAELRKTQMAAKEDPRYDGHCANLAPEDSDRRIRAGESHVIRLRVPESGECVTDDILRGKVRFNWHQVDQQILMKSDGFPTYHLANVVDDHLMGITHVIRGEEWLSSLPKHIHLYNVFGWEPPVFVHMPLLRNPDKSKLSKRKNPTSIFYYRDAGFLPQAVLNYLGLMAYTLPDGREMFAPEELAESLDLSRISLGGPVFDISKLTWLNGRYLREKLEPRDILNQLKSWKLNDEFFIKLLEPAQKRLETLADFIPLVSFMFCDRLTYPAEELTGKKIDIELAIRLLRIVSWEAEKVESWSRESIRALFENVCEHEDLKLRDLTGMFFVVVSGSKVSLPLFDSVALLGRDLFRRRIFYALEMLDAKGYSLKGKQLKRLESDYRNRYD